MPNQRFRTKIRQLKEQAILRVKQEFGAILCEFIKRTFKMWERFGLHLTMNHYYEPVPDTRKLKDTLWQVPSKLVGLDMNDPLQLNLLSRFVAKYKQEYDRFPIDKPELSHVFYLTNPAIPVVDGEILYCMIRDVKPRKIIEIGSGYSTYLSAQALLQNQEDDPLHACELIAIEPYPNQVLQKGFPGFSRLIQKPVQEVPLAEFESLNEGDILFIDSSHILKIGSDVQYEYLEILPRLKRGVFVHIHDIHFPFEYPKGLVLQSRRFWNEQYLRQAFLAFNDCFQILWASHYMLMHHSEILAAAFDRSFHLPNCWPSSCWIRRVR